MEGIVRIDDRFSVARFAPDREALQQAAQEGFRSVVNMRSREEKQELPPDEERRWVEAAGLTYLHHPVSADHLSDELVDAFRRKATDLPAPVLVHCASGKRSGAMVMMHLASEQGWSGEQVIERAEAMGFECDTPELEEFVKSYVNRHNGQ